MRRIFVYLSIVIVNIFVIPPQLYAQTSSLTRVANGVNPLIGTWVSQNLALSSAMNAKRVELIFLNNSEEVSVNYMMDGTVTRRYNSYTIQGTDYPDEGYLIIYNEKMGMTQRCEFRISAGLLYINSRETGLAVFKRRRK